MLSIANAGLTEAQRKTEFHKALYRIYRRWRRGGIAHEPESWRKQLSFQFGAAHTRSE